MTKQQRINQLEQELEQAKKNTYVGETHQLHCNDGELYIYYGDANEERCLVMDAQQLFKDLPFIIDQVTKENKKMQDMYMDNIKDAIKVL